MKNLILKGIEREIENLFYSYIKIRSDTFTDLEKDIEPFLMNYFNSIDYFKTHKDYFGTYRIPGDILNRSVCWCLVEGDGEDTIVLIHHNDVVDIEDFKTLKPFAYSPFELQGELNEIKLDLPPEAKRDLESGNYIFGRGTADMKAGGAIQLSLINRYSRIKNLKGNIVLLSVPDEENLSSGMRGAVLLLEELKKKYNLNYLMMINSEPHQRVDENIGVISEGSVGKILPFVYVRGALAHIGKIFEGFNPISLITDIVQKTELSIDFCDFIGNEASPPPTWLYFKDKKSNYDVSLPLNAAGYFSVLTLNRTPDEVIKELKKICVQSFEELIIKMNNQYSNYMRRLQKPIKKLPWKSRVVSFKELYEEAYKDYGEMFKRDYDKTLEDLKWQLKNGDITLPDINFNLIELIFNYINDSSPRVVIGLLPPYYPCVSNLYYENIQEEVRNISHKLIKYSKANLNQAYTREYFYTGISDLSYTYMKDFNGISECLKENMPLYNSLYSIPFKEIKEVSMPCMNIGPWGKDFHKLTERVLKEDLLYNTPHLLNYAISNLLGWNEN